MPAGSHAFAFRFSQDSGQSYCFADLDGNDLNNASQPGARGMKVVLDLHNYGRYNGDANVIGGTVPVNGAQSTGMIAVDLDARFGDLLKTFRREKRSHSIAHHSIFVPNPAQGCSQL